MNINKTKQIVSFNDFACVCPYFTTKNNGYGCTHPEQEEVESDKSGVEQGKCYSHSCPLGFEPDEEDFENPDIDWDGITKKECISSISGEFTTEGEYIVVDIGPDATEDKKAAWLSYKKYINRYNPEWQSPL